MGLCRILKNFLHLLAARVNNILADGWGMDRQDKTSKFLHSSQPGGLDVRPLIAKGLGIECYVVKSFDTSPIQHKAAR